LAKAILLKLIDLLLNPKQTIEKFLMRRAPKRKFNHGYSRGSISL
jgi:hypothetical protein